MYSALRQPAGYPHVPVDLPWHFVQIMLLQCCMEAELAVPVRQIVALHLQLGSSIIIPTNLFQADSRSLVVLIKES